jgi:hypothetical protein
MTLYSRASRRAYFTLKTNFVPKILISQFAIVVKFIVFEVVNWQEKLHDKIIL